MSEPVCQADASGKFWDCHDGCAWPMVGNTGIPASEHPCMHNGDCPVRKAFKAANPVPPEGCCQHSLGAWRHP